MISIHADPRQKIIIVSNEKNNNLEFGYNVWVSLAKNTDEEIYGLANGFLATLSQEKNDLLWDCYVDAYNIIHGYQPITEIREELTDVFNRIEVVFEFDALHEWAITKGGVQPDLRIAEVNTGSNSEDMTILRDEAMEIVSFSIIAKIASPIWGTAMKKAKEEVENLHKEKTAVRSFLNSNFKNWKPYKRLERYLAVLAGNRSSNNLNIALTAGMPSSSLEEYLMAHTLTRRLAVLPIFQVRKESDPTIVAFIYKHLDDQIRRLSANDWRDKGIGNNSSSHQETDSIADNYRVSQSIIAEIPITMAYYIEKHFPEMCRDLGFIERDDFKNINDIVESISNNQNYEILENLHLLVCALTTCGSRVKIGDKTKFEFVISPGIIPEIKSRESHIRLIAIAAYRCYKYGLMTLYKLLLSVRKEKKLDTMSLSMQNGMQFQRIPQGLQSALIECYPHRSPLHVRDKTCPGIIAINKVLDEVGSTDWYGVENLQQLSTELATLILKEFKRVQ